MKLSIVVPCYNEEKNIPLVLDRFRSVLAEHSRIELLMVNNGSTDGSAGVMNYELRQPRNQFARRVDVPVNEGYGYGILAGLKAGRGEYLAWTHADLQTDPNDVLLGFERLMRELRPEQCFVRGRRIGRPGFDKLFTSGMGLVASTALRAPLHDINAQPKIFHRQLFESFKNPPHDFSLDLYVLYQAHKAGLKILEQPVEFAVRQHGEAKGGASLKGKVRLTRRTLSYIFRLRRQLSRAA